MVNEQHEKWLTFSKRSTISCTEPWHDDCGCFRTQTTVWRMERLRVDKTIEGMRLHVAAFKASPMKHSIKLLNVVMRSKYDEKLAVSSTAEQDVQVVHVWCAMQCEHAVIAWGGALKIAQRRRDHHSRMKNRIWKHVDVAKRYKSWRLETSMHVRTLKYSKVFGPGWPVPSTGHHDKRSVEIWTNAACDEYNWTGCSVWYLKQNGLSWLNVATETIQERTIAACWWLNTIG